MTERPPSTRVSLDIAMDALANRYRRRLLVSLLAHNPQDDDDPQIPADEVGADDLDELHSAMVHSHLPKLEDAGFILWDRDQNVVRTGPRFGEIKPLLELLQNHADELPDDWL